MQILLILPVLDKRQPSPNCALRDTYQLSGMASTLRMRTTIRKETLVHDFYASVNSSCAHASWPNLRALAFNVLALNGKFPGSETHKLPNDPRWEQRRGQIPLPKSSLQQFSLTAQSRNATLSNLRCNFFISVKLLPLS